jgi:hypothetical protein
MQEAANSKGRKLMTRFCLAFTLVAVLALSVALSIHPSYFVRASTTSTIHKLPPMTTHTGGEVTVKGNLALVGVEGFMDASGGRLAHFDMPFQLNGRTATKFQATVSYRDSGCSSQALMLITVDGVQAYRAITKLTHETTVVTVPLNYDFALPMSKGRAVLHVETDGGCQSDWEIQGVLTTR